MRKAASSLSDFQKVKVVTYESFQEGTSFGRLLIPLSPFSERISPPTAALAVICICVHTFNVLPKKGVVPLPMHEDGKKPSRLRTPTIVSLCNVLVHSIVVGSIYKSVSEELETYEYV